MKRRDLLKKLNEIAGGKGQAMTMKEGGNHTLIDFDGKRVTVVPRHNEVNEITAVKIIKQAEGA